MHRDPNPAPATPSEPGFEPNLPTELPQPPYEVPPTDPVAPPMQAPPVA